MDALGDHSPRLRISRAQWFSNFLGRLLENASVCFVVLDIFHRPIFVATGLAALVCHHRDFYFAFISFQWHRVFFCYRHDLDCKPSILGLFGLFFLQFLGFNFA
jgi:hypothetical protein